MLAPTILPPPGESASTTTIEQSESHQALAESTPIRRLTRGGLSTERDWGRSSGRRACTMTGTDEGEVLIGTRRDDVICGFGGGDVVRGRGGGDTLLGGGGGDSMVGGGGGDTLRGARGEDVLDTQDDVRGNDLADGGLGRDVCVADRRDTTISCT
jgi:Ca2+-binding RTX toxin-like protein